MKLFNYNLHHLLYLCSYNVYLLSIVYLCFSLLASMFYSRMFYSLFQHVSLLFAMFYHLDVVGLAFLGQDMPKFCVCAQIHVLRCFLPCSRLVLFVYVLIAMFMPKSTCLCALQHVYAQIYLFMFSLPYLCLDLYFCVLLAMFMCLDPHVGCQAMCL